MWIAGLLGMLAAAVMLSLILGGWAAPFAILALLAVVAVVAFRGNRRRAREQRVYAESESTADGEGSRETLLGGTPDAPEPESPEHETWTEKL